MNEVKIFVSSTCYDLTQIRADLHDFISSIGHIPVLSDFNSFPIDPDSDTLENCLSNVSRSDIFILILGGRYGFEVSDDKSITNYEYLHAKSLGIPSYVFIYKPIINILALWKANKSADFSTVVDSTKIFEFVEIVREKSKQWCYEFEKSQDIVPTLKIQLSNLFKLSLDLRRKYDVVEMPRFYSNISGKALNIILKKDIAFETLFFAQNLQDELAKHENLKLDLEYKIMYGCSGNIEGADCIEWISNQFSVVDYLLESFNNLFNDAYRQFYGKPGEPSDLNGLYYVSTSIARIFKEMIEWTIRVKSTRVDEDFTHLRDLVAEFLHNPIKEIWEYGQSTVKSIEDGIMQVKATSQPVNLKAHLALTGDDHLMEAFAKELKRLKGL
jgi:hypothetical protein